MKKTFKEVLCIVLTVAALAAVFTAVADGVFSELADAPILSSIFNRNGEKSESAAAVADGTISGEYAKGEHTREEIVERWRAVETDYSDNVYKVRPNVVSPYSIGQLEPAYISDATAYLSYCRFIAKLPDVVISQELCESSQYGATLMAATNTANHMPPKPADMSDEFYNKAIYATDRSNIARSIHYDYYNIDFTLRDFIVACFSEESSVHNLTFVTHRRWFLHPSLYNIGFGQASAQSGDIYTGSFVYDQSNPDVNYNYVAWPSSGWFPNNMVDSSVPWSVCFNSAKYSIPNDSRLSVKVTRKSDGAVFNMTTADNNCSTKTKYLMNASVEYYPLPLCLTFHLGSDNHLGEVLTGDFEIEIGGIQNKSTQKYETIKYTTRFFSVDDPIEPETDEDTTSDTTPTDGNPPSNPGDGTTASTTTKPTTTTTTTKVTTTTKPSTTSTRKVTKIELASKPTKLDYYYKESLSTAGMTLKVTYSDKSTAVVKSGFTCNPTTFNDTGTRSVTVQYGGQSTSFSVNVSYSLFQYLILIFLLGFLWY